MRLHYVMFIYAILKPSNDRYLFFFFVVTIIILVNFLILQIGFQTTHGICFGMHPSVTQQYCLQVRIMHIYLW